MRKPDSTLEDLSGDTYSNLTVISYFGMNSKKQRVWVCQCTCGDQVNVITNHLRKGVKKSCGCLLKIHPKGESQNKEEAIKYAAKLITYDAESGHLYWNVNISKFIKAGRRVGCKGSGGYRYLTMHNYRILEHRLCWWIVHNKFPDQIDHINGVRSDNRLCNLREANNSQNNMNRPRQSNNTTGYKGVSYHKQTNRFHAVIRARGVTKSLGYHKTAEEAFEEYVKAAKELHGEFANTRNTLYASGDTA